VALALLTWTGSQAEAQGRNDRRGQGRPTFNWREPALREYVNHRTPDSELHRAAAAGDAGRIRALVEAGTPIDQPAGKIRATPLHEATYASQAQAVGLLLELGADANSRDKGNMTPLHLAALQGDADAAKRALAVRRWAAIHFAARTGDVELVGAILEQGGDVSIARPNGWTALHHAVQDRHLPVVKLLVAKGADLNKLSEGGVRPLHVAAQVNDPAIAEYLIEHGAEIDAAGGAGSTPLHLAAINGSADVARVLLAHGASQEALNEEQKTPLELARARPGRSERRKQGLAAIEAVFAEYATE
jgi:ankyrin repeat protein